MYSPNGESLAGEAGISAGSEGVAIQGKEIHREHLKCIVNGVFIHINVYNYYIPVSDCV